MPLQLYFRAPWALEISIAGRRPPARRGRGQPPALQAFGRSAAMQVTLPVIREFEVSRGAGARKCSPFARAKTQNYNKLSARARQGLRTLGLWDVDASDLRELRESRPKVRADCLTMPRPCPFVGCRHHTALVADLERDSLKEVFPELRIIDNPEGEGLQFLEEMIGTCSLDIADKHDDGTQGIGGLVALYQAASGGGPLGQTPGMTIKETGRHMNLSVERVRQLASGAMQEMRIKLRRFG